MAEMINQSRLSNAVRSAGMMRRALHEALCVARGRTAFGRRLIDLPLMQRQLLKIMLPAEEALSLCLFTAAALRRADEGEETGIALRRILTPLVKFRCCRDARKAAGDAMEVRGGCGYIEDWSDPRLLRDAHLGSIWEGTSNIVALDVLRAIRREAALPALEAHLRGLLRESPLHSVARTAFDDGLQRSLALAQQATEAGAHGEVLARQVASSLYHITSAIAMAWEAGGMQSARRMRLAQAVVRYRLHAPGPLDGAPTEPDWMPTLFGLGEAGTGDSSDVAAVNLF